MKFSFEKLFNFERVCKRMAQDWTRECEELSRLVSSAKNDIDKMIGYERKGQRETMMTFKRNARAKLKQVATRYPDLQKQLNATQGITDSELKRRARELKKLGTK